MSKSQPQGSRSNRYVFLDGTPLWLTRCRACTCSGLVCLDDLTIYAEKLDTRQRYIGHPLTHKSLFPKFPTTYELKIWLIWLDLHHLKYVNGGSKLVSRATISHKARTFSYWYLYSVYAICKIAFTTENVYGIKRLV